MEPKDLKNSDELKSPEKEDLKPSEKETKSEEVKKTEVVDVSEKEPQTLIASENEEVVAEAPVTGKGKTTKNKAKEEVVAEVVVSELKAPEKKKSAVVKEVETTVQEVIEETESIAETDEPAEPTTVSLNTEPEAEPTVEQAVEVAEDAEIKAEQVVEPETLVPPVQADVKPELKTESKKAVKQVAEKTEETADKQTIEDDISGPSEDYSEYSQVELVNALRDVLKETDTRDIRNDVEAIKACFYKILTEKQEEALKTFIEGGGVEAEFQAEEDPYENDIKDLLKDYRHLRIEHNKQLEQEKEDNLKRKYEVIEKIKSLINNEESINKTFNDFRDLQQEWREIGLVPQAEMKNLWDTYHFHVENFYDYIKINRELRDLDLKKNLESKIELCEKAEELLLEPSIIKAFNTLQKYHEQWREIGPVPREQKDDIWERFKSATAKINKKHQEFFENRKTEQKENLDAKTALCEKVEEILEKDITSHKELDQYSKEIIELQKVWRTIGFAPRKDNNRIYERFRTACDKFFDAKRDFYSKNKEEQLNNLQLKIDLCVQAEALKDSNDWKKTTQEFINIQKKWKEVGPVPRKQSESVWKRFRTACDYFFEHKSEHFSDVDSEQVDNLKLKEEIIKELKAFKSSGDVEENLKQLKQLQRRWAEIGHVPFKKKDELQSTFRELINKLYDDLKIDDEQRNILKFRTKMTSFSESSKGQNKMRLERDKYMNKMKQLESDLVLLDNNIGFFAKSKNAEVLIKDVKKKIEQTKQKIEFLKDKIRVIDELDASEE